MEKAEDEVSLNSPIISDCDKHFSDKQLQAIETAFLSTASSSSIKNGRLPHSDDGCSGFGSNSRRRLSDSIILQVVDNRCRKFSNGESSSAQIYNSFALLPCPRNWGFHDGIPPGTAAVIQIRRNMTPCYIMHIIHSASKAQSHKARKLGKRCPFEGPASVCCYQCICFMVPLSGAEKASRINLIDRARILSGAQNKCWGGLTTTVADTAAPHNIACAKTTND
ncbi:hypothetical protein Ancab_031273 [Ancistrocladus abbreviatus]